MSSIRRWRSGLIGRSIVGAGIGSSSHDEGNSMLERQLRPAQDLIENAHKYRGPGARSLAGFGAAPQPCLLRRSMVRVLGITHPAAPIPRSGFVLRPTSAARKTSAVQLIRRRAVRLLPT